MYFNLIIHFICSILIAILCLLLIKKITNNKKIWFYEIKVKENENSIFNLTISFQDLNITTENFTDCNWHSGIHRHNSTISLEKI
ncbi:hypothetical protein D3C74_146770 [compost metagenome]